MTDRIQTRVPLVLLTAVLDDVSRAPFRAVSSKRTHLSADSVLALPDVDRSPGEQRSDLGMHVDPNRAVTHCLEVLADTARERGVRLHRQTSGGDGTTQVDSQRLERVVGDLIANAIKYSQRGGSVEVETRWTDDEWRLVVTDDGKGINPLDLPDLFEQLARRSATDADADADHRQAPSSRLARARETVVQAGGEMTAASEGLGRGASFTVSLCRSGAPSPAPSPEKKLGMDALRGSRILLVENDTHLADNMCRALRALGADVDHAADLQEALTRAESHRPTALVSNIHLASGSTGYEVLRALSIANPGLPAVALSAIGTDFASEATNAAGFSCPLARPVELPVLVDAILRSINASEGALTSLEEPGSA